jgi:hypothetical protein
MFPSACSFIVLVTTVSLHVSAYMAIFMCVGYFIFICLKDSVSLLFSVFFSRGHTQHVSICVVETCSETVRTNTIKLHADGNITCNTYWTIQCSRMLKYSKRKHRLTSDLVKLQISSLKKFKMFPTTRMICSEKRVAPDNRGFLSGLNVSK